MSTSDGFHVPEAQVTDHAAPLAPSKPRVDSQWTWDTGVATFSWRPYQLRRMQKD